MKILFNGWFDGFLNKTNPGLHVGFFIDLFECVYGEKCEIGMLDNSDILCEFDMMIGTQTMINKREWKHTYLFSGESTLKRNKAHYTCVMWGERNHKNVVNVPLFIPYIYTNNFINTLETKRAITAVPKRDVCVIISNPRGKERTDFLNQLEQHFNVCYAGGYKNNIGGMLKPQYNSNEYRQFVKQFKFIISMENSREDTYITEKIINGLLSDVVPVYWGSEMVRDYINKERFLCVENIGDTSVIIHKMKEMQMSDDKWLTMVNQNCFPNVENKLDRTLTEIAADIKCIISIKKWNHIDKICCVSNPVYEPERCVLLNSLFNEQDVDDCYVKYISPTYKHTITPSIYNDNVKSQLVRTMRRNPMKNGELSLFLNYKSNLEYIVKNFKEGTFLIFESDAMIGNDIKLFNHFMGEIIDKDWDLIHIGSGVQNIFDIPIINGPTGYRKNMNFNSKLIDCLNRNGGKKYIEDITNVDSKYRLIRKFHTRCTDSFIWRYDAIVSFLDFMNTKETNFGSPFDYYMCNFFELNISFKHYWTLNEFFKQGSNLGLIPTTLQN